MPVSTLGLSSPPGPGAPMSAWGPGNTEDPGRPSGPLSSGMPGGGLNVRVGLDIEDN